MKTLGIDISHYQKDLNWYRLKDAGVRFAFIKSTEGATWDDPLYQTHLQDAIRSYIYPSAYHLLLLGDGASSINDQIEHFKSRVNLLDLKLPPALDVETAQIERVSPRLARMAITEALNRIVEWAGQAYLYCSARGMNKVEGAKEIAKMSRVGLWVVDYSGKDEPKLPPGFKIYDFWQFSSSEKIRGYDKRIDADWFHASEGNLRQKMVLERSISTGRWYPRFQVY